QARRRLRHMGVEAGRRRVLPHLRHGLRRRPRALQRLFRPRARGDGTYHRVLITWGAPTWPPTPPNARGAPGNPWRPSGPHYPEATRLRGPAPPPPNPPVGGYRIDRSAHAVMTCGALGGASDGTDRPGRERRCQRLRGGFLR